MYLFLTVRSPIAALFMTHSEGRLKRCVRIVPAAYPRRANQSGVAVSMPASNTLTWLLVTVSPVPVPLGRAPAILQVLGPVILLASEVHQAPAPAGVSRAGGFLADFPAAARPVFRD